MKFVLFLLGVLAVLYGVAIFMVAESAVHEIQYLIAFLIGAVFISAGGICDTIGAQAEPSKAKPAAPPA